MQTFARIHDRKYHLLCDKPPSVIEAVFESGLRLGIGFDQTKKLNQI